MEELHTLGTESRNAQQIEQAGRDRRHELLALWQGSGLDQRGDFLGDPVADAGKFGEVELAVGDELGDGIRMIGHRARRIAIRANLERIACGDLEEIGDVTQETGDLGVLHAEN